MKLKKLNIELVGEEVEFDNFEQSVDDEIYTLPLQYTSAVEGVRKSVLGSTPQGA
jgi:UDP-glucuronate 4-epimerase